MRQTHAVPPCRSYLVAAKLRASGGVGTGTQLVLGIADCPVDRARNWVAAVNRAFSTRERDRVQVCITRNRAFGGELWQQQAGSRLGPISSLRPEGRPRTKKGTRGSQNTSCAPVSPPSLPPPGATPTRKATPRLDTGRSTLYSESWSNLEYGVYAGTTRVQRRRHRWNRVTYNA